MKAGTALESVSRRIEVESGIEVSALVLAPLRPRALYVLAHGAGADMRHRFMDGIAQRLAALGIATLRYQFPYTEQGKRRIDPEPLLLATVRAAVAAGVEEAEGRPLLAGGKSMGGRMTSRAAAAEPLEGVAGLVFLGFPLHPAGQPGTSRAEHLARVGIPMLFLQGARDTLAETALIAPVVKRLGSLARLHLVEGADHSFHVLARSGRNDREVMHEILDAFADWARAI